jgi:hypothetical protein
MGVLSCGTAYLLAVKEAGNGFTACKQWHIPGLPATPVIFWQRLCQVKGDAG